MTWIPSIFSGSVLFPCCYIGHDPWPSNSFGFNRRTVLSEFDAMSLHGHLHFIINCSQGKPSYLVVASHSHFNYECDCRLGSYLDGIILSDIRSSLHIIKIFTRVVQQKLLWHWDTSLVVKSFGSMLFREVVYAGHLQSKFILSALNNWVATDFQFLCLNTLVHEFTASNITVVLFALCIACYTCADGRGCVEPPCPF